MRRYAFSASSCVTFSEIVGAAPSPRHLEHGCPSCAHSTLGVGYSSASLRRGNYLATGGLRRRKAAVVTRGLRESKAVVRNQATPGQTGPYHRPLAFLIAVIDVLQRRPVAHAATTRMST
jgi:hypothetical protein